MPLNPEHIIKSFEQAKNDRVNWDTHWQDVADYVLPSRSFNSKRTDGSQRRGRIYNTTAPEAAIQLAAALEGMLFNTGIRWFELTTDDEDLNKRQEVQRWLYDSTNRMLAYFDNSATHFSVSGHEKALDLVTFGTGVTLVHEKDGMLKFQARDLSGIYAKTDDSGSFTDVFREFEMPAWEVIKDFGVENVSEKTRKMSDDPTKQDKMIKLVHHVYLRVERDMTKKDSTNKEWGSVYLEVEDKHILSEGGFDENPYIIARWSKAAEEVYGRSPAMEVLPSIRVVNAMARTNLEAAELAVRPPIVVTAGTMEGAIRTSPGSIMYVRQGTRDYPQPFNSGARPDIGESLMEREEDKIQKAFFADRLSLPQNDRMTATEIIERRQQGLLVISPILSRLYAEWLNPVIQRTFKWMRSRGMLFDLPDALTGVQLKINYVSPLAVSRRSSVSQAFLTAMSAAQILVQVDPTVMQNLDTDGIFRSLMINNNVDPSFLKTKNQVAELRQQQQEQEHQVDQLSQIQAAASAASDGASAARDLGLVGQ